MSLFVCQAAVSGRNRLFSGPLFDIIQVSHRRGRKDRREKGISMKLSEKICACRTAAGLSPETLAERLGVSPETVSLWESGGAEPDLARLRLLAAEFHVSADWLLSDAPLPEAVSRAPAQPPKKRGFRQWGWMFGIRVLALPGAALTLFGLLGRFLLGSAWRSVDRSYPFAASGSPLNPIFTVLWIVGLVLLVAGTVLAVALYPRRR